MFSEQFFQPEFRSFPLCGVYPAEIRRVSESPKNRWRNGGLRVEPGGVVGGDRGRGGERTREVEDALVGGAAELEKAVGQGLDEGAVDEDVGGAEEA